MSDDSKAPAELSPGEARWAALIENDEVVDTLEGVPEEMRLRLAEELSSSLRSEPSDSAVLLIFNERLTNARSHWKRVQRVLHTSEAEFMLLVEDMGMLECVHGADPQSGRDVSALVQMCRVFLSAFRATVMEARKDDPADGVVLEDILKKFWDKNLDHYRVLAMLARDYIRVIRRYAKLLDKSVYSALPTQVKLLIERSEVDDDKVYCREIEKARKAHADRQPKVTEESD